MIYRTPFTVGSATEDACVPSGANSMEGDMKGEKSVLVVGLDPTLIDFSLPGYPPGMTATKVFAGTEVL